MTLKIVTSASGRRLGFLHRSEMKRAVMSRASLPAGIPATTLPIDCTGNAKVSAPMDLNDTLGICGLAMCDHKDGIRSFGQGQPGFIEINADETALKNQYLTLSGGDNGTDEDMLVGNAGGPDGAPGPGAWFVGIAGNAEAIVEDHLDVDGTDIALCQYLHDWFYGVEMAWSVPDAFLQTWVSGSSWLQAMTPDPENGHFTTLADVDSTGNYRLWTWGGWCWVSPAFVASVEPQCFVTFSGVQFLKASGLDSHGRHVSDVAAAWVALGGNSSIAAKIVADFPAKS
jgi:hypothetical protein